MRLSKHLGEIGGLFGEFCWEYSGGQPPLFEIWLKGFS